MAYQQAPSAPLSTSTDARTFFMPNRSTAAAIGHRAYRSGARKGVAETSRRIGSRTNPSKTRATTTRPSLSSGDQRTTGGKAKSIFSPRPPPGGADGGSTMAAAIGSMCSQSGSSTLQPSSSSSIHQGSSSLDAASRFFASKKDASVSKRQRLDSAGSSSPSSPASTPLSRVTSSGSAYSPSLGPRPISREVSGLTDTSSPSITGAMPAAPGTPISTSSAASLPRSRSGSTTSSSGCSSGGEGKGPIERSNKRRSNSLESVEGEGEDDGRVPAGFEESVACRCTGRRKCGICRGCAGVHCKCLDCWCRTCTERERQRLAKEENERKKREYELECAAEQERLLEEARLRMVTHNNFEQQASSSGGVGRTVSEEEVLNNADWRSTNPYRRLGLNFGASLADIKKNYHKLALLYHPDRRPGDEAAEAFVAVRQAYEELAVAHGADP